MSEEYFKEGDTACVFLFHEDGWGASDLTKMVLEFKTNLNKYQVDYLNDAHKEDIKKYGHPLTVFKSREEAIKGMNRMMETMEEVEYPG